MVLFWVTLLLLHRGYSLVPVIQGELDKPVNFTCVLPDEDLHNKRLFWFKQSAGHALKLMATVIKFSTVIAPEFSESRLKVNLINKISTLTILRTIHEDEGMYHCAVVDWTKTTWTGMYLSVKGNSQRTSEYTVVERSPVSGPVHPGDSVTLQCAVLSSSETKTCPGGHSMFWFRAGSDESHPEIIYTEGNDKCEKTDAVKSCIYRFSKNFSSSDAGTYRCAVATCGQILFGNGTKVEIDKTSKLLVRVILMVCLAFSVFLNVVFICYQTSRTACQQLKAGIINGSLQAGPVSSSSPAHLVHDAAEGERDLNYAALHFSEGRASRGRKKNEESVYAQVQTSE